MTELDPRTRELLERARWSDEPSSVEREHNRNGLAARLMAAGLTVTTLAKGMEASNTAALGTQGAASGTFGKLALGKLALSWLSMGALAGAVLVGTYQAFPERPSPGVAAPSSSAPRAVQSRTLAPIGSGQIEALAGSPELGPARSAAPRAGASTVRSPAGRMPEPRPQAARADQAGALESGSTGDSSAATRPQVPPDLDRALAALRRAQRELVDGRPDRARAELDRYAGEDPAGPLAEEREALRIVALCTEGDARGRAEAERFLKRTAHSPLATRVRAACRL